MVAATVTAVGHQQAAVPLRLRLHWRPVFTDFLQRKYRVLIAGLITNFLAHNKRHRFTVIRGGHRHIIGRIVQVIRLQAALQGVTGLVQPAVLNRLVTVFVHSAVLTLPGLDMRAGKHGAARGVVYHRQAVANIGT